MSTILQFPHLSSKIIILQKIYIGCWVIKSFTVKLQEKTANNRELSQKFEFGTLKFSYNLPKILIFGENIP